MLTAGSGGLAWFDFDLGTVMRSEMARGMGALNCMRRTVTWSASPFAACLAVALVMPAHLVMASGLDAQDGRSIGGVVRDESSGLPVEGATVSLHGRGVEVVTAADGLFYFPDLPSGSVTLRVMKPEYITIVDDVYTEDSGLLAFEVLLPRVDVVLQDLFVQGEPSSRRPSNDEVQSDGRFRTALDFLAHNVPGVTVHRDGRLGQGAAIRVRGVGTFQGRRDPVIYIDGVKVDADPRPTPSSGTALDVLQMIPADQVLRVRVLRGASATVQYPEGASGVILIETVRGGEAPRNP